MNKKIKYIPCTFDDEVKHIYKICDSHQLEFVRLKRKKEKKEELLPVKSLIQIIFDQNNNPELVYQCNSILLRKIYKLGFYTFASILEYYKQNYEYDLNSSFISEFDNLILYFRKYEGESISIIEKELIVKQQLIAEFELQDSLQNHENKLKERGEARKGERKVIKQIKVQNKEQKQREIALHKELIEARQKYREEQKKERSKVRNNKRELNLQLKIERLPKKSCLTCNKEFVFDQEKETISIYNKKKFCDRECYSIHIANRKIETKIKTKERKREYQRKYSQIHNDKIKLQRQERKKEKIDGLEFRMCYTCQNPIPKSLCNNRIKVYERIKFCSDNCKKNFPKTKIKREKEKEALKVQKMNERLEKRKKKEEEILLKKELKMEKEKEKERQKELFYKAILDWDKIL